MTRKLTLRARVALWAATLALRLRERNRRHVQALDAKRQLAAAEAAYKAAPIADDAVARKLDKATLHYRECLRRLHETRAAVEAAKVTHTKLAVKLAHRRKPLRVRALEVAESLVGVMEHGGNNVGPKVTEIIRANGGAGPEPWCGDFVAYCYRQAGSKMVTRSWAAVRLLGWLTGMRVVTKPVPGAIIIYNFGTGADHTGLFRKWYGSTLDTIEGNTGASGAVSDSATGGDGVYEKRRSTSLVTRYVVPTR
jgi:hypothetical protein